MTSSLPTKQSRELSNAIYDDWKRKVVDEAKKRAVGQNVDYEAFKNMVAAAHLRPLHAANMANNDRMLPSWQYSADGSSSSSSAAQSEAAAAALALMREEPSEPTSSSGDFYREWRRNCPSPEAKYRYLALHGPRVIAALFKVEINSETLKEILEVVEACWQVQAGAAEEGAEGLALREAAYVVELLGALSTAGRFSLTLTLMGPGPKKVIQSLFTQLDGAAAAAATQEEAGLSSVINQGNWKEVKLAYGLQ